MLVLLFMVMFGLEMRHELIKPGFKDYATQRSLDFSPVKFSTNDTTLGIGVRAIHDGRWLSYEQTIKYVRVKFELYEGEAITGTVPAVYCSDLY